MQVGNVLICCEEIDQEKVPKLPLGSEQDSSSAQNWGSDGLVIYWAFYRSLIQLSHCLSGCRVTVDCAR